MTITEGPAPAVVDTPADPAASARLLELAESFICSRALHLAAELGIADHLAAGPAPVQDLAAATGTVAKPLYGLLRLLASRGVFTEYPGQVFDLAEGGQPLRSDHPLSVRVTAAQAGRVTARVFGDAMHALRTGTGAFEHAFGVPVWEYLRSNPEEGAAFDTSMHEHSRVEMEAVLGAYNFAGTGTTVDIGGGDGTLLCRVLGADQRRTGILFDLPHVVERNRVAEHGLQDRCSVVGGDLFGELPTGGDLYLMKSVLHGWTDEQVVDILHRIRQTIAPSGRLLLIERIVPEDAAPHPSKAFDFAMMVMAGGQERTAGEYVALLDRAGFSVSRVIPTGSVMGIVEAAPAS